MTSWETCRKITVILENQLWMHKSLWESKEKAPSRFAPLTRRPEWACTSAPGTVPIPGWPLHMEHSVWRSLLTVPQLPLFCPLWENLSSSLINHSLPANPQGESLQQGITIPHCLQILCGYSKFETTGATLCLEVSIPQHLGLFSGPILPFWSFFLCVPNASKRVTEHLSYGQVHLKEIDDSHCGELNSQLCWQGEAWPIIWTQWISWSRWIRRKGSGTILVPAIWWVHNPPLYHHSWESASCEPQEILSCSRTDLGYIWMSTLLGQRESLQYYFNLQWYLYWSCLLISIFIGTVYWSISSFVLDFMAGVRM